eukprot:COSAG06_NODE_16252_length_1010_cov_12.443469_1_plen_268_part_01
MESEQLTAEMVGLAYEKAGAGAWAAEDRGKRTPLHGLMGSEQLTAEMVELACEKAGADAWVVEDRYMKTPLHCLMQSKQLTAEVVGLACEKARADAWAAEDEDKNTPLHYLMESKQLTAEMVGQWYEKVEVGAWAVDKTTFLHSLVQSSQLTVDVIELVFRKVDVASWKLTVDESGSAKTTLSLLLDSIPRAKKLNAETLLEIFKAVPESAIWQAKLPGDTSLIEWLTHNQVPPLGCAEVWEWAKEYGCFRMPTKGGGEALYFFDDDL